MDEFVKLLSSNATVTNTILIVLVFAVLSLLSMFLVAFFQGREISFWPPKIGPKPRKTNVKNQIAKTSSLDPSAEKGTYISSSIDRDLKGETAIDDIKNVKETIHVTHFSGRIPNDEYINAMVEKIEKDGVDTIRIVPDDACQRIRDWIAKFKNLNHYTQKEAKTKSGFDMLILDRQKVRLYFPTTTDAVEFKRTLTFDDKEVADCFLKVFERLA